VVAADFLGCVCYLLEAVADERCCGGNTANIVTCAVCLDHNAASLYSTIAFPATQPTVVAATRLLSSVMEEAIRLKISVPYFPLYTVVPLDLNDRTIPD
jgi:hypothetical protein